MTFWPEAWASILWPHAPLAELVIRGTGIYLLLFAALRVTGRRLMAQLAASDILVMMLIAVAVRDGITGPYQTVGDAAISGATILGWDLVIDRLAFRFPGMRRVLRHQPVAIIDDGVLMVENARAHLLTRTEILERVREEGLTSIGQVREAWLEQDGSLSIVPA